MSEPTVGRLCVPLAIACRAIVNGKKGKAIRIETLNLSISMPPSMLSTACQPAISVDTKKKELVGNFRNGGREWQPRTTEVVQVHDFMDKALGKAILTASTISTATKAGSASALIMIPAWFAVETIRRWWWKMGAHRYPAAQELLITADGGGSNGSRCRLWKVALQNLAHELAMPIQVCHFPPGTSKWNKIEHRMFCHITENWRGHPLESLDVIVNLIANTATRHGLLIQAELDTGCYPTGIKVSDHELLPSISNPPNSTANGTIPLHRKTENSSTYFDASP